MDIAFINAAQTVATENENNLEIIEKYIETEGIQKLWAEAVNDLTAEFAFKFSWSDYPAFDTSVSYGATLTGTGVYFDGTDGQGDWSEHEIPYAFLLPETRQSALDDLRASCVNYAQQYQDKQRKEAERRTEIAERELARAQQVVADLPLSR